MPLCKTLKPVHHTFMRTYNQLKIIVLAELHDTIRLQLPGFWLVVEPEEILVAEGKRKRDRFKCELYETKETKTTHPESNQPRASSIWP